MLALKLALTPALIASATLVGRRWGPAVSGWLVGFPFTSGPVAFFVALEQGPAFAVEVAVGTLAGTIGQVAFCLAYAAIPVRAGWPGGVAAGAVAFAAVATALGGRTWTPGLTFVAAVLALAVGLGLMPRGVAALPRRPPPRGDLVARMAIATTVVLLLTGLATTLGPRLTGLLSTFPLYAGLLAVFAHALDGRAAALGVLRGLLLGLFGFAAFFLVLALLVGRAGLGPAFAAALAAAGVVQGLSLRHAR